jgi:glycosyl transferase family 25
MGKRIPITVINLKKDVDKKNHIERQLSNLNLKFDFFEAIYGDELSANELSKIYNPRLSTDKGMGLLSKGEIGCALSHFGVYQKIVDEDIDEMIVLEDDAVIGQNFVESMSIITHLPKNWELFLLGYSAQMGAKDATVCNLNIDLKNNPTSFNVSVLLKMVGGTGTHGYVINKRGAKRLLSYMSLLHLPIDFYTGNHRKTGNQNMNNIYIIHPRVVGINHDFDSSIGDEAGRSTARWKLNKIVKFFRDFDRRRRKKGKFSITHILCIDCIFRKIKFRITHYFKA